MTELSPEDFLATLEDDLAETAVEPEAPTETEPDPADDDSPIFSPAELEELLDGHKPEEPAPEAITYETLEQFVRSTDEEIAARVTGPISEAEFTKVSEDYDLKLEILSDRRRAVDGGYHPRQRAALDREWQVLAAEKAAFTTAAAVQAEQRAMAAYESSPLGVEEKESIARGVKAAQERVERMAEAAEAKRQAAAKRQAKDLRKFYGGPQ